MTVTTKTRKPTANLIERKYIAATNTVLYTFQSSRSDHQYFITSRDGVIDTATHLDCIGYKQHGHCCHMDMVIKTETPLLQAHKAATAAEPIITDAFDFCASIDTCTTCGGNHNTFHHGWSVASMDERQAMIDRLNAKPVFEKMDRAAYDAVFDPSGLAFL